MILLQKKENDTTITKEVSSFYEDFKNFFGLEYDNNLFDLDKNILKTFDRLKVSSKFYSIEFKEANFYIILEENFKILVSTKEVEFYLTDIYRVKREYIFLKIETQTLHGYLKVNKKDIII